MAATPIGFFGLKLVPGKVHRIDVIRDFRLTNISYAETPKNGDRAILKVHYTSPPDAESDDEEEDEEEQQEKSYTLCTLVGGKIEQAMVDIQFCEEEIGFSITGNTPVDLIGNYVASPDMFDQEPDSEDEYDSEDDEDDMYGDLDGMDGDDDEDMEEDDSRFEEISEEPKQKKTKAIEATLASKNASPTKKRSAAEMEADKAEAADAAKLTKNQAKRLEKKVKTESPAASPASKKDASKVAAQLKKATESPAASPASKKDNTKAAAQPKAATETPTKSQAKDTKPKAAEKKTVAKEEAQSTKKTLPSGLIIEDKKIGSGPVAKSGQRVGMRYVGKLPNGKVFDQCVKGKPFNFKLGKGEVIKGWDEGVKGMQIGSERRLTCPPSLAYGNQKLPGIPANSTLIFDVKLVEIK